MVAAVVLLAFLFAAPNAALAQLRGHGGPVRAVAASHDGVFAVSAGFDGSAIVWGLKSGQALDATRAHDAPATAAATSRDIAFASGDQNGRVAAWRLGAAPRLFEAHAAPVVGLAAIGEGATFLSAGLDGSITRIDGDSGAASTLAQRLPPLAAICASGAEAVVADREGGVRRLGADGAMRAKTDVGALILAMACDGPLVFVGTAEGRVLRVGEREAGVLALMEMGAPITALATQGGHVAAATATGEIALINHGRTRALAARRGGAVWGLAFAGHELLAAGHDGFVRRYEIESGRESEPAEFAATDEVPAALREHSGARTFEACRACHSLKPGENRAGPSLAGVIGRRAGTAPGYAYSEALKRIDLTWDAASVARLFEIGPAAMTPGTKMPEQRVVDAAERGALAEFLAEASR